MLVAAGIAATAVGTPSSSTSASSSASADPSATVVAPVPPPPATPTPLPVATHNVTKKWTSKDAENFWTAARLESATEVGPQGPRGGSATRAETKGAAQPHTMTLTRPAAAKKGADGEYFDGTPTVGLLFLTGAGMEAHFCTASVVQSPGSNLILTAAHCTGGDNAIFIPRYQRGKSADDQPHGAFAVDRWFRDSRYRANDRGPMSDLDFAFARVKPNTKGVEVQKATGGGNKLTRTPGYNNSVSVIGYPKHAYNPGDRALRCPKTATTRLTGYKQMRMECGGFYGGTSGSPWLLDFNASTGTGKVIGNIGGWNGGGPAGGPGYDRISFSPYYDDAIFKLYDDAVNNRTPQNGPRPYTMHRDGGSTWVGAQNLATGDYTGDGKSDMIVVWSTGEVTLYTGNGRGGFSGETVLKAKNKTWPMVRSITGGNFAGGGLSDLVVRWVDGEVSLYTDVSPANGLSKETELKAKGAWKNVTEIVAGRFSGNKKTDDLLARWSDGRVTLYTDVDAGAKLKREKQLRPKSDAWKGATVLASGDFTGNDNWDVLVRWKNGGLTLFTDVSQSAKLDKGLQMKGANNTWPSARPATAGSFSANGYPDDLIVRWIDGEVTLYSDNGKSLGKETQLVPPRVK
ncbi:trypsin-like serine protease [Streptomyces sp. MST-110588]|uniref:trypsin-like serine peptidase n=1 Tax=Streptomyces sp. MST-110588 TaxID=2833628 RepID=UPI001F5C995B|nr:trypsin-like serine protease [Streptomyces sp. MST-110588]UNO40458.1 trypsin-like serine protease [Streptomyces sp. MST-110588]